MALPGFLTSPRWFLVIGYFTLVIGLYYVGYSQGRAKCDKYKPDPIDENQYKGGMAGIILGCIVIVGYHIKY